MECLTYVIHRVKILENNAKLINHPIGQADKPITFFLENCEEVSGHERL
jgi:hypothetical protein